MTTFDQEAGCVVTEMAAMGVTFELTATKRGARMRMRLSPRRSILSVDITRNWMFTFVDVRTKYVGAP